MITFRQMAFAVAISTSLCSAALAEESAEACPGFIIGGSDDVMVEGNPAAAVGTGTCVIAVEGSENVKINGRGAVRVGDKVTCLNGKTGTVVGGATSVHVNGRPLAGAGAEVVGCED